MTHDIFIDSDIILDLILGRQPFDDEAKRLFALAETGTVTAHTSSVVVANLYYILRKQYSDETIRTTLKSLRKLITILPVDEVAVDKALSSGFPDFEDALQYYAALAHGMSAIITRNIRDYRNSTLPVMTAKDFLLQFSV